MNLFCIVELTQLLAVDDAKCVSFLVAFCATAATGFSAISALWSSDFAVLTRDGCVV